ncbi:MAG: hypothetical protein FWD22_04705 [Treponema sp.]|nr:hypothetical protein [Treponema sp.]
MKKVLVFVFLVAFAVNSHAQTAFDYMMDSLANVVLLSTVAQLDNFDYNGANALLGTYLEAGKTITMRNTYTAGVEYLMLAAPDLLDCDVDLKVYQGSGTGGTVIAKDTRPDSICVVRFKPTVSGEHTFELINSSNKAVFVSVVTLRAERNPAFTLVAMAEAIDHTFGLSQLLASSLPANAKIPANKWTLFGGKVNQGSLTGYFNSQYVRGDYILVGAGEKAVRNVDAEVVEQRAVNQTAGTIVSVNTETVALADFAIFTADPTKYYYPRIQNKSSSKTSAFCFGFLIQMTEN